jgi:parallel beta-helix repeat protein
MEESMKKHVAIALFLLVLVVSSADGQPQAVTIKVDCDAGGKIGAALVSMKPGDTLLVKGICRENIAITAERSRLTLDGQGQATIDAPDGGPAAIQVIGRDITIRGFTITGGRNGINVLRGGTAVIANNVIHHTGPDKRPGSGEGINVGQHSFARFIGNTIRDNPNAGILVHESGAVRIGFTDVDTPSGGGNVIENNGGYGIRVSTSSNARIAGNIIRKNGKDGVLVSGGSNAHVSGNVISGNGGSGVMVIQSSVLLGSDRGDSGTNPLQAPNTTDAGMLNRGSGIRCEVGGSVDGRLGSLNGREGSKRFDKTCVNSIVR